MSTRAVLVLLVAVARNARCGAYLRRKCACVATLAFLQSTSAFKLAAWAVNADACRAATTHAVHHASSAVVVA